MEKYLDKLYQFCVHCMKSRLLISIWNIKWVSLFYCPVGSYFVRWVENRIKPLPTQSTFLLSSYQIFPSTISISSFHSCWLRCRFPHFLWEYLWVVLVQYHKIGKRDLQIYILIGDGDAKKVTYWLQYRKYNSRIVWDEIVP